MIPQLVFVLWTQSLYIWETDNTVCLLLLSHFLREFPNVCLAVLTLFSTSLPSHHTEDLYLAPFAGRKHKCQFHCIYLCIVTWYVIMRFSIFKKFSCFQSFNLIHSLECALGRNIYSTSPN